MFSAKYIVALQLLKKRKENIMMYEWFECKVKYNKTMDDGKIQKVSEPYLVDALSFTEAEKRIIKEMEPYISGEFTVTDIKRAKYAEIFETTADSADKWYKCKLAFITLDEKSGKEKKTTQTVLVQAADLHDAVGRLDEGMKTSQVDYSITAVDETLLMDVFHFQQSAPEGFVPVIKDTEK